METRRAHIVVQAGVVAADELAGRQGRQAREQAGNEQGACKVHAAKQTERKQAREPTLFLARRSSSMLEMAREAAAKCLWRRSTNSGSRSFSRCSFLSTLPAGG